jgi:hypothetical protein
MAFYPWETRTSRVKESEQICTFTCKGASAQPNKADNTALWHAAKHSAVIMPYKEYKQRVFWM